MEPLTKAAELAQPGATRRAVLHAVGGLGLALMVLAAVFLGAQSAIKLGAANTAIAVACNAVGVKPDLTDTRSDCRRRINENAKVASTATTYGSLYLGGAPLPVKPPVLTTEVSRDPSDPCPMGDPADLCRCRHELRDTQAGLRQTISGQCAATFRRRAAAD